MIKKLTLKNFQAHSEKTIHLDPGITTLVGPTDSGKTAVLRALRWLCQNRPRGDSFLRDGGEEVSVALGVDGQKVTRSRRKGSNSYKLDRRKFSAFGADVPREVADLLSLSDLNFQGQLDSPLWLTESPGEVSRRLNEVVDLSLVDKTLTNLSAGVRRTKAEYEVVRARVTSAKQEKRGLRKVKGLHQELLRLEGEEREIADLEIGERELERASKEAQGLLKTVDRAGESLRGVLRDLSLLEELGDELRGLLSEEVKVSGNLMALKGLQTKIEELNSAHSRAEEELRVRIGERCPLCGGKVR